jgi:hypothetical protein
MDARRKRPRTCRICGDYDGKVLPETEARPGEVVRVFKTRFGSVCNTCAEYVGASSAEETDRID